MTKLAIDCRMSGKSGIGSYFDALLPYFIQTYECVLICTESKKDFYISLQKENKNIQKIIPTSIGTFSIKELLFFPKEILQEINLCEAYYTPYCNIPRGIKIPIFSTIHDIVFLDIPLASKIGTLARKWFYKNAIKKSRLIFTVSNFSAERIRYHLHCKKDIVVTYNASNIQNQNFSKINSDNSSEKSNTLLFVGNIKKHKGLHVLLDAFRILQEKRPETKLIIVGNADNFRTEDDTIKTEIEKFGDKVQFTGFISNDELRVLYENVSLLVQPSFYEGFGMPPLEALSCHTNVVLSDIPVFKEIYDGFPVTFFKTGNSTDLAEKILFALDLPKPEKIPDKYSFKKTFDIIRENINGAVLKVYFLVSP